MEGHNTAQSFKKFLSDYCKKHPEPLEKGSPLPFRLLLQVFSESELKGECMDVALQYLKSLSCPNVLALALTQQAVTTSLEIDLSQHLKDIPGHNESKAYDASAIAHLVISNLHSVCVEWSKHLPDELETVERSPSFSEYGIKNVRRKMEDQHNVFTNLNHLLRIKDVPPIQFYAVYDGHGGLDASNYASKHLHLNFAKQEDMTENVLEALKKSIKQTDDDFCAKAKNERLRSGTTAVVAVIFQRILHLSWVGDSQAIVVRDGQALTIMNPHKPEREDEKKRIEEMGGCVVWFGAWRVNGSLAVSRAIGDADHKPYVCGDADTATVPLDGSEDYLCLACDGFWDVFSPNDLVRLVREYIRDASNDRSALARHLCLKAKDAGSTDNITVVIIFLRENINLSEVLPNEVDVPVEKSEVQESDHSSAQSTAPSSANVNNNNLQTPRSNNNQNNNTSVVQPDGLTVIKGRRMEPGEKARVPNKLLVHFVKKLNGKEVDKSLAIVTESCPHSRLPRSLNKPRWTSPNISPRTTRRDTSQSILSLSTIASAITELPPYSEKTIQSASVLPLIEDAVKERHSLCAVSREKGLGYRAAHRIDRPRVTYPASVVSCQPVRNYHKLSTTKDRENYCRSIPGDLNHVATLDLLQQNTDTAITNSLVATLKPLKDKAHRGARGCGRSVVRLSHHGRQRSKSAL